MADEKHGKHMAKRGNSRGLTPARRGEPLRDNYSYEQPRDARSQRFEDMASYSSARKKREDELELERQRKSRGKKKMSRGKKAVIITLTVLVVLIAGGCWYVFGYLLKDLTVDKEFTTDLEALGIVPRTTIDAEGNEVEEPVVLDSSVKNIAMFGVDSRTDSFDGLSDVIMILTVDNKHDKIKMTSILRDSCVVLDDGSYAKLTEVYSWGGPETAVKTINQNFSIGGKALNITEYVTVNFARMADIINAVDGIDLEITGEEVQYINKNLWSLLMEVKDEKELHQYDDDYDESQYPLIQKCDFFTDENGYLDIENGEYDDGVYHLNGNQAVAYGRIRKLDSDDMRAVRQQKVLTALIQKVKGMSKLEYPEMIRQIMPMCKTSLDFNDIVEMLPIMFTDFTIETMNIPGEEEQAEGGYIDGEKWVYVYDLDFAAKHISTFIYESDSEFYGQEYYIGETDGTPYVSAYSYSGSDETDDPVYEDPVNSDPDGGWEEEPISSDPDDGWGEDPFYEDPGGEGDEPPVSDPYGDGTTDLPVDDSDAVTDAPLDGTGYVASAGDDDLNGTGDITP